ncbi:MAG: sigma-54-dependent Fis family transcriptional regulator [Deltaproteobacteria bacterium]|nr:sigma-54-dependent Fis family transcriptional regulator [Deltaproteobacteria bacterium]
MTHRSLRVLVVDDNRSGADALARVMRKQGDAVDVTYDGASAIQAIEGGDYDLVLTDLKMEPVDGMQVLQAARALRPPVEVIVFTAYGATDIAVKAMRMGARDFLTKPVTVEQIETRLDRLRTQREDDPQLPFTAGSQAGQRLLGELQALAEVQSPVWLEGEIGSGRGHAARTLHALSGASSDLVIRDLGRADAPWPAEGTVLLPNVDQLPQDLQLALHRALLRKPERVRLIATAAPESSQALSGGTLRPELYYQLAVIVVRVPPLRERTEDIPALLTRAMSHFADRYLRTAPEVQPSTLQQLQRHGWPGNIRELINLAERAVVLGQQALQISTVTPTTSCLPRIEPGFSVSAWLESQERMVLEEALRIANGDRNLVARLLGLERNTLRYKLNKYGLL